MKKFFCLFFVALFLISSSLQADWLVDCNGQQVILSISKDNLIKEKELFIETFSEAYKNIPLNVLGVDSLDNFLNAAFEDEEIDFARKKANTLFITAKDKSGKVVGFASFDRNSDHIYSRQGAVHPSLSRSGLGKNLLFSVLNVFKDCYYLKLVARRVNNVSKNFCSKLGFVESSYIHEGLSPEKYIGYELEFDGEFVAKTLSKYILCKILSSPIVSPEVKKIRIEECCDPLIDLNHIGNKRIVPLTYFDARYDAGHHDCGKVRKGLYDQLLLLLKYLPENIGLAVFEGYRPLWKQKEYFVKKFKELAEANNGKSFDHDFLESVYVETCKLISPFIDNIPVHCTGAAIDFMLFEFKENDSMELLDLGKFGVIFGPNDQAQTLSDNVSLEQRINREMLLNAAAKAGLVNYGYEWWHYSYGDRAWAYVENEEKAIYGMVIDGGTGESYSKEVFLKSMSENIKS